MQKSCERGANLHLFRSFLPFFDEPFAAKGVRKSTLRNVVGDVRTQILCDRVYFFILVVVMYRSVGLPPCIFVLYPTGGASCFSQSCIFLAFRWQEVLF